MFLYNAQSAKNTLIKEFLRLSQIDMKIYVFYI